MTQAEMVGRHHRLDGHGFGWTLRVGDGQGGLVCCDSWGRKEADILTLPIITTSLVHAIISCLVQCNYLLICLLKSTLASNDPIFTEQPEWPFKSTHLGRPWWSKL